MTTYQQHEITEKCFNTINIMLNDREVYKQTDQQLQHTTSYVNGIEHATYDVKLDGLSDHGKSKFPEGICVMLVHDIIRNLSNHSGIIAFLNSQYSRKILIILDYSISAYTDIMTYNGVEIFRINDVMYPIIYHNTQPQFKKIPPESVASIMSCYQMNKSQFPEMCVTDPVARYYNLSVGDIIRIIRPSTSAIETFSYRIVVPSNIDMLFEMEL